MICKQCGREIPDHAIYCRYCGTRCAEQDSEVTSPKPVRKRSAWPLAAVLLLVLAAGIFLWLRSCRGTPAQSTETTEQETESPAPAQPDTPVEPAAPVEYTLRIEGDDNIEAGKDVILKAVVEPGTEINRVVWTSSSPCATVVDGIVTGESAGDTIIRCLAALESGPVLEAELPFHVLPKPVKYELKLEPEALELYAGTADSFTVSVQTEPEGESTDTQIEWESSDTMVAAVTDGRVQAVGEGTAKITARVTLPDGSVRTLQGNVKVTPAQPAPAPSPAPQTPSQPPAPAPAPAPTPAPAPAPAPSKPTFTPEGVAPVRTEDYLMSNSDSEYLSVDALLKMDDQELRLARNEIFARHGRRFDTDWIREYFEGKSWYQGTIAPDDFDVSVMNAYELENVSRLKYAEEHN